MLIGKFVSGDGKSVDYKSLRASAEFGEFRLLARELQRLDLANLTPIGKKTFFISMWCSKNSYVAVTTCAENIVMFLVRKTDVYLALSMHGLAIIEPKGTIELTQFYATAAYNIGGHNFTLDDIEHGILRGVLQELPVDNGLRLSA